MIANCPKCHESVLLPAGVSAESRVRCPLCQEEYPLGEALRQLPPALIVLELAPSGVAGYSDAYELAAPDAGLGASALAEASTGMGFSTSETAARPVGVRKSARPKRPPKNPALEGVKIVLGGMVGLFMAQMILWWLPGTWRRDPFGWAPNLGAHQATRLLVPKDFWAKEGASGASDGVADDKKTGNDRTTAPPKRGVEGKSGIAGSGSPKGGTKKPEIDLEVQPELGSDEPIAPDVKRQLDLLNDLPDDPLSSPAKPAPKPALKQTGDAPEKNPIESPAKPSDEPRATPPAPPAEKPAEKPVEKPSEKPEAAPEEKPAEKPAAPPEKKPAARESSAS